MDHYDIIIVGAGWHGLAMARTWKLVCPSSRILVIDKAKSVGGVWAEDRLYPGLKTNNLLGSYEFSDFPLIPEKYGLSPTWTGRGVHIPGTVVHRYLQDSVEHFQLQRYLLLGTTVQSAELREDETWCVITEADDGKDIATSSKRSLIAKRLILATGLTSEPFVPSYAGQDTFRGMILHSKQLKEQDQALTRAQNVVVIGGNKSAFDVCYNAARAGAQVHMIMRPTGGGPSWVWPAMLSKRFRVTMARVSATRLPSCFDPCIWGGDDGSQTTREFLHRTWLGRLITWLVWSFLGWFAQRMHGLKPHKQSELFAPWISPYWMGNSLSIHNYESSWFEVAQTGKIEAHIADVKLLSHDTVHLSNGTALKADILVCCTGWKAAPPIKFIPEDIIPQLGLPHQMSAIDKDVETSKLRSQARKHILNMRPDLRNPPRSIRPELQTKLPIQSQKHQMNNFHLTQDPNHTSTTTAPYQLYRFMVPPHPRFLQSSRNIGFIGAHLSIHAVILAQAQALWLTAFFLDAIPRLQLSRLTPHKLDSIHYDTLLLTEYERLRHPPEAGGSGARYPDLVFDSVPYVDVLLRDLGLGIMRKSRGKVAGWREWAACMYREWLLPYSKVEYRGLIEEWIAQNPDLKRAGA